MTTQRTAWEAEFEGLFEDARAGDQDAAALFVRRYGNWFLKIMRDAMDRKLRNRMDPADLVQDFYMKVLVRARGHKRGAWMPYLQVAAKNVVREANRRHHAAKRDASRDVDIDAKSFGRMPSHAVADTE